MGTKMWKGVACVAVAVWGGAADVSSVRPHLGSRAAPSTGARHMRTPYARASLAAMWAMASTSSGCHEAARPSGPGKDVWPPC